MFQATGVLIDLYTHRKSCLVLHVLVAMTFSTWHFEYTCLCLLVHISVSMFSFSNCNLLGSPRPNYLWDIVFGLCFSFEISFNCNFQIDMVRYDSQVYYLPGLRPLLSHEVPWLLMLVSAGHEAPTGTGRDGYSLSLNMSHFMYCWFRGLSC